MAFAITIVALFCFNFIALLNILALHPSGLELFASLVFLAMVFTLQTLHSAVDVQRWPARYRALTVSLQALATYLPFLWLGKVWGGMAGFLAGSILLAAGGGWRWALLAGVIVSVMLPPLLAGMTVEDTAYLTVSTVLTGLVVYGLRRLAALVAEVHATRGELARLAVTRERLRVARDLHDLLGYNLSAITLKAELVYRLLPANPDRAREEVADLLGTARQALSDVRLVASGYRDMSLAEEANSAVSVLAAADVETELSITCGPLPQTHDTTLATVLREAVTNILRHSKAQHCVIRAAERAGAIRLEISNDGADVEPATGATGGSGLHNLSMRLTGIGGFLSAADGEDGWFRLVAEAPLPAAAPAAQPV
ncbi:sensor histidine kinase [Microbispora sp. CA-135349]|uniref:sensor histidine kinase n=1 Tax=Microbispora sp. CA-135349 TaxID=3239953 RepID=UPI003D8DA550